MAPNAPFPGSGLADPANLVLAENARFTVLGPTLIRLEWSATKAFEDRPSFFAVQRSAAPQAFKQSTAAGRAADPDPAPELALPSGRPAL